MADAEPSQTPVAWDWEKATGSVAGSAKPPGLGWEKRTETGSGRAKSLEKDQETGYSPKVR